MNTDDTPTVEHPVQPPVPAPEVPVTPPSPVEPTPSPEIPQAPDMPAPEPAPTPDIPPPTPTPAPQPVGTSFKAVLARGLEKIRFRKRAKLEKIVALARERGSITNDDVEKLVRVSDSTASRYLRELVATGRLRRSGSTSQTTYSI